MVVDSPHCFITDFFTKGKLGQDEFVTGGNGDSQWRG